MKEIKLKHAVLAALFAILVVPMFNTAHLYEEYSDLTGFNKIIACYFLGIVIEFSIFLCIKGGIRAAGIFFAFLSFIIGMLFHTEFSDIRTFSDWYTREFLSETIIQFTISAVNYGLAEFYVYLLKKEEASESLSNLNRLIAGAKQELDMIKQTLTTLEQTLKANTTNNEGLLDLSVKLEQTNTRLEKQAIEWEQKLLTLKRTYSGTSKKKQTINPLNNG